MRYFFCTDIHTREPPISNRWLPFQVSEGHFLCLASNTMAHPSIPEHSTDTHILIKSKSHVRIQLKEGFRIQKFLSADIINQTSLGEYCSYPYLDTSIKMFIFPKARLRNIFFFCFLFDKMIKTSHPHITQRALERE